MPVTYHLNRVSCNSFSLFMKATLLQGEKTSLSAQDCPGFSIRGPSSMSQETPQPWVNQGSESSQFQINTECQVSMISILDACESVYCLALATTLFVDGEAKAHQGAELCQIPQYLAPIM